MNGTITALQIARCAWIDIRARCHLSSAGMQADADYERMGLLNDLRRALGRTLREAAVPRLEAALVHYPFRSAARDPAAAILAQPLPVDLDRSIAEVKDLAVSLCPELHHL